MRGTLTLTFATTVAIGMLALGVGALTVTSNMQMAQAANPNCTPYGSIVSNEARTGPPGDKPGFGDEVSPLAQGDGLQDIREPGNRNTNPRSDCGQSNVQHGNN
jgi:hypothetical protein